MVNMPDNMMVYGLGAAYLVIEIVKYLVGHLVPSESKTNQLKLIRRNNEMIHDIKEALDRQEPQQLEIMKLLFKMSSNLDVHAKAEERIVLLLDRLIDKIDR